MFCLSDSAYLPIYLGCFCHCLYFCVSACPEGTLKSRTVCLSTFLFCLSASLSPLPSVSLRVFLVSVSLFLFLSLCQSLSLCLPACLSVCCQHARDLSFAVCMFSQSTHRLSKSLSLRAFSVCPSFRGCLSGEEEEPPAPKGSSCKTILTAAANINNKNWW